MRILMLVMSDVTGDSRVRREAASLVSAGHDVTIIGDRPTRGQNEVLPGVHVHFARASTGAPTARGRVPQAIRWLLLPWHRRRQIRSFQSQALQLAISLPQFRVVHAHDFSALPVAAHVARSTGGLLVYDAHELWTGRRLAGRPTPLQRWMDARRERRHGDQAEVVLTVSEGIAEQLDERYGWGNVKVVRNSFPLQPYVRPTGVNGVLYAGRIDEKRDLETFAQAASALTGLRATAIGPDDGTAQTIADRVTVRAAVPADELDELYREHGLALVPLSTGSLNHQLALPNKLFQAVRAGVPVVAADLTELRRLVQRFEIGTLYRPGSSESLRDAILATAERYDELIANVRAAREQLSWEHDEQILLETYRELQKGT